MSEYIISVKRDFRGRAPLNLASTLSAIPGLSIRGHATPYRIRAVASDDAIEHARVQLGAYCHIEPLIAHHPELVAASG